MCTGTVYCGCCAALFEKLQACLQNNVSDVVDIAKRNSCLQFNFLSEAMNQQVAGPPIPVQGDGNLVLYSKGGSAYWATGTANKGTAPYQLVIQVGRDSKTCMGLVQTWVCYISAGHGRSICPVPVQLDMQVGG
jgi:hypothetical protein